MRSARRAEDETVPVNAKTFCYQRMKLTGTVPSIAELFYYQRMKLAETVLVDAKIFYYLRMICLSINYVIIACAFITPTHV